MKGFKCQICNKAFARSRCLKAHLQLQERKKLLPFKCNFCEKKFTQSHHLTSHVSTHTKERAYKCKSCPKDFRSWGALNSHSHTSKEPFKGQDCRQELKWHADLKKHSNVQVRKNENSNSHADILRLQVSLKRCEVRLERLVT